MSAVTPGGTLTDIPFRDTDFDAIARLAKSEFGLHLDASKKTLIRSRLSRRLRSLGLPDFATYCSVLRTDTGAERDAFISALTTNVTHFFREPHHFDLLETTVLPDLLRQAKAGRKIRLWSAGCSTGQEAFSMAASVRRVFGQDAQRSCRILATDIDPKVLHLAEAGTYRAEECRFPQADMHARIFEGPVTRAGALSVRAGLRELIAFRRLNLIKPWPMHDLFDAIFCRNVAIYFDADTQAQLWQRFAAQLSPGGYLFIGHSERMHGPAAARFETAGVTVYRLREDVGAPAN